MSLSTLSSASSSSLTLVRSEPVKKIGKKILSIFLAQCKKKLANLGGSKKSF